MDLVFSNCVNFYPKGANHELSLKFKELKEHMFFFLKLKTWSFSKNMFFFSVSLFSLLF